MPATNLQLTSVDEHDWAVDEISYNMLIRPDVYTQDLQRTAIIRDSPTSLGNRRRVTMNKWRCKFNYIETISTPCVYVHEVNHQMDEVELRGEAWRAVRPWPLLV